jgi:hypothetical protein
VRSDKPVVVVVVVVGIEIVVLVLVVVDILDTLPESQQA